MLIGRERSLAITNT